MHKRIIKIKGYPSSLKLVKHGKSRFYWVHFSTYISSKGTIKIRKSTKTENQAEAIDLQKTFTRISLLKKWGTFQPIIHLQGMLIS